MKIVSKDFKHGFVKLIVNDNEDLWTLSRIVQPGDIVGSVTSRLIKVNDKEGFRKKLFLKINVEKVEFSESSFSLRILGRIIDGSEDAPSGSYHSFNITVGAELTISKDWDLISKKALMKAEQQSVKALLIIVESSQADFLLVGSDVKLLFSKHASLPRKDMPGYDNALNSFYEEVCSTIRLELKNRNINHLIIAGPGFYPEELIKRVKDLKPLKAHCHHLGVVGARELINNGVINKLIANNELSVEASIVNEFFTSVGKDKGVVYGFNDTLRAVNESRVNVLLVSESLIVKFREGKRFKELESLINIAERTGSKVEFISDKHEAGKRFSKFSGIGALLRF